MGLYPILPLLGAAVLLIMAIFVYTRNKNSPINITYALFLSSLIIWLLGTSISYILNNQQSACFWRKLGYSGVVLISPLTYCFIVEFLYVKRFRIISAITVAISLGLVVIIWKSDLLINGAWDYGSGFYYMRASILQPYFLVFFTFCFVVGYMLMFYKYFENKQKGNSSECNRIAYVIAAIIVGNFGAIDFIPMYGICIWPFGFLPMIIMVSIFAYAILRHNLLDIEIIVKKTLLFSCLFAFIYAIFAFFVLLGQLFFERFVTQNRWIAMIPSVIVVTIILRPLESFLINITDRYLFQKKYNYKELLKSFTSEVLSVLDLDNLLSLTKGKLAGIMNLEYCDVILEPHIAGAIGPGVILNIPIKMHDQTIARLLLGKKRSDREYSRDDIEILQSLAKTLGIAITNARLLDELSKAQQEMAQKDRMATIGTLAAGMAHEIRNPITAIRVFSEYVPDRLKDNEFRAKYRNVVTHEVDKIDHIIQTLIDFSGEDRMREDAKTSAHESVEELISIISKDESVLGRIRFINNIPKNIGKVNVIKEELDEIILNLAQNAIHAIAEKGTITFSAKEYVEGIIIEISDTGSGMPEETRKHIFDPFFTTRSKGFGLGLFVVRELVERNRGKIEVRSEIGKGTKFSLKFKRTQN